ncbi:DISARM system helicase DrmA [Frankia sp. Ag45/Mut15]|uniref:DISARM system helicase DrmA n=1 Tax=Frankia umida TaxID=573489 RepID=A0ABT0JYY5_9ACTN|nr:DISARM system helicase DrmA [Frankia umida]MCK9876757.1 DISARM system helicase DrmA [Frankia umida]
MVGSAPPSGARLVPEYRLAHQPDGSSVTVRENLVDILERELLGPAGGPEELLSISPRQMYLVGHIAPVKLAENRIDEAAVEDGEALAAARDDLSGPTTQQGIPALSAEDGAADSEDGDGNEDRAPQQGLMIPASMGLRFQVPADLAEVTVTASWGIYEGVATEEVDRKGRPLRAYRRTPVEIVEPVRLAELTPGRTHTRVLSQQVCLRIDVYEDERFGRQLVEIALCNDKVTPPTIPVAEWMFQTRLHVAAGGEAVFLPVRDVLEQDRAEDDEEVRRLDLQYRHRLEFAIGRTCSADWAAEPRGRRASAVWTTWLPTAETPQTRAGSVADALLSMDALAHATTDELRHGLRPLVEGYGNWLDARANEAATLPAHLRTDADEAVHEARRIHARLAAGLEHLVIEPQALECFHFMNAVMRDQRLQSQIAALRSSTAGLSLAEARERVQARGPAAASWFPFQLAFILLQLPGLTDPTSPARSGDMAGVELLFFPTGGGKTEAYLGLAAYTLAIRRRQGVLQTADGPLDGRDGVSVLMRYTLRLLTSQQFQRATAMICAAELARRADEARWGHEPFRIGLWVGTDVSPKRWNEANEQLRKANEYGSGYRLTVLQIQRCPWCGTPITPAQVRADAATRRVFVYCGDDLGRCPFSRGGGVDEGLPVLTVDEEIYRLTPAFVIATVDKFARLAREGEAASLFGYVSGRCGRHGYAHPDYAGCSIKTSHRAEKGLPAAGVRPVARLRPPDLIIQDELHLITGALGTTVGLFEAAVETLCSWRDAASRPVQPMIVASTATVRNAEEQVRALYGRRVRMFPPQVLDVADTFFSEEVPISPDNPGRRYIGISAQGVRLSSAEIRVAEVLLSAGQLLFDRSGAAADPYMTLVGYFNATRELAGMSRYIGDDVQTRVRSPKRGSGFPRRYGSFGYLNTGELTARIASADIGRTLDALALEFDPGYYTSAALQARIAAEAAGHPSPKPSASPLDVVLATSMLQVGVDVQRLGLMLVVGQPKNTAEYIQASSRVGRDPQRRPGLVVALGNWARPRDLAHYEQFRYYHETFYAQVEALSVTPFSPTALERGLDGVLVAAARVMQGHLGEQGLSPERDAWRVEQERDALDALVTRLRARILAAAQSDTIADQVGQRLANRLDQWSARRQHAVGAGQTLVYEHVGDSKALSALMISPEHSRAHPPGLPRPPFVVANSMREVQPEINLLVSPLPQRLAVIDPPDAPTWQLPAQGD